jgi:hypothetical protein
LNEIESEEEAAAAALVPVRTKQGVDETTVRKGKWTADEDSTLRDAVEKHNDKQISAVGDGTEMTTA